MRLLSSLFLFTVLSTASPASPDVLFGPDPEIIGEKVNVCLSEPFGKGHHCLRGVALACKEFTRRVRYEMGLTGEAVCLRMIEETLNIALVTHTGRQMPNSPYTYMQFPKNIVSANRNHLVFSNGQLTRCGFEAVRLFRNISEFERSLSCDVSHTFEIASALIRRRDFTYPELEFIRP